MVILALAQKPKDFEDAVKWILNNWKETKTVLILSLSSELENDEMHQIIENNLPCSLFTESERGIIYLPL
jgi:hypothetical protein